MIELKYPIFVKDRDGWVSIVLNDVNELEVIDVKDKEFEAWDSKGSPLRLYVKEGGVEQRIEAELLQASPQIDKLKEVILNYAKLARPKTLFVYSGPEGDIVELYKSVEDHINAGRLRNKIRDFFKNIKEKCKTKEKN